MNQHPGRSPRRHGYRRFLGVLAAPCREHGRLMSLEIDGHATRAERWGLRVHYLVCGPCRRLWRDFRRISAALRGARDARTPEAGGTGGMPADARARIEASFRR